MQKFDTRVIYKRIDKKKKVTSFTYKKKKKKNTVSSINKILQQQTEMFEADKIVETVKLHRARGKPEVRCATRMSNEPNSCPRLLQGLRLKKKPPLDERNWPVCVYVCVCVCVCVAAD